MAYLEVTAELRTKLNELINELDVIEAKSQKTAGKRARVMFTELKKLNRPWKLELKQREAAYPKQVKAKKELVA
jgi:hypothetical protein